jgi:hypothetical protein
LKFLLQNNFWLLIFENWQNSLYQTHKTYGAKNSNILFFYKIKNFVPTSTPRSNKILLSAFLIFPFQLNLQNFISAKKEMSDNEDPYAVSSDSEDEEKLKKPPPKINIEGRSAADFQQIVSILRGLEFSGKF